MNPVNTSITWQTVEATEAIQYLSRAGEATFAPTVSVPNAKRRAPDLLDIQEAGALLASQALVWHVWASQLNDTVPKERDVIQDLRGVRWTVKSVAVQALGQRYRLTCLRERP